MRSCAAQGQAKCLPQLGDDGFSAGIKAVKIGLLDHMGYGNLGDAATQDALMASIADRLPKIEFVGFSLLPADTERRHKITTYPITWCYPASLGNDLSAAQQVPQRPGVLSLLKQTPVFGTMAKRFLHTCRELVHLVRSFYVVRSLDALIIAGGGQLSELWGGPWAHPYNVVKFSILTKLARKKLIILNVGAGPINRGLSKLFVRWAVNLADYVSFRDRESEAAVRYAGVRRPTRIVADSAYLLEVAQYQRPRRQGSKRGIVGINPIGYSDPRIWPRKDEARYYSYLDRLTRFCKWLLERGYRVRVFSGEKSVDLYALDDLKARLEGLPPSGDTDILFRPPSRDVHDLLTELADLDFVVTSKFHGVVFSHLLGKPVIALSYHKKIDHLMQAVGHANYCLDIGTFDEATLENTFTALVDNAADIKELFSGAVKRYRNSLRTEFDELFLPTTRRFIFRADAKDLSTGMPAAACGIPRGGDNAER